MIEGPAKHLWPASNDLETHINTAKTELEKTEGVTLTYQFAEDEEEWRGRGGSRAFRLASVLGRQAKRGLGWVFNEEQK